MEKRGPHKGTVIAIAVIIAASAAIMLTGVGWGVAFIVQAAKEALK